jgi:hypothetical protein
MQIETTVPMVIDVDAELDKIARRYKSAGGVGINVLNLIGGSAESLLDQLPDTVRRNLETATVAALNQAMRAAHSSRSVVPDQRGNGCGRRRGRFAHGLGRIAGHDHFAVARHSGCRCGTRI